VNCAPIRNFSQDAGKTAAEAATDEMVMGAVQALCEFSALVSQQNYADLSLAALDDALEQFSKKKGAFRDQKMLKSVKATGDELLARESHHLQEQKIHKIRAAMEVQLYGAEKVTTPKWRQFQVRLNRAQQAATIWSDADQQRAIERLGRKIHHVTPAKLTLFDKVFQHHELQLLQEVGTEVTGPSTILAKTLAQMKSAVKEESYGVVNMTTDKRVQFQVCLSNAEIEATTCSIADTDRVVNHLEWEIYGITSKDQMGFMKEFCICLGKFEARCQPISVQELQKTIEQCVIHLGYPKMLLLSHISESSRRMGSSDNVTTDISEWLHIGNVKEAYRSTNEVNYIQQMLKHNDRCTSLE